MNELKDIYQMIAVREQGKNEENIEGFHYERPSQDPFKLSAQSQKKPEDSSCCEN